jgi:hypothetical protein
MKNIPILLALLVWISSVNAEYKETLDPNGLTKNLQIDFGVLDDNAQSNQSDKLQKAIETVYEQGGGCLILPKGTYSFAGIAMKSNVHLLIEKDTVIKPWWTVGKKKATVFSLDGSKGGGTLENVSIRGLDGAFIVDYSDRESKDGIKAVDCKAVRNFLLSDIFIKEIFTTYCAVTFTMADKRGGKGNKENSEAVDGLVKNLISTDSSPGYGLVQMHAGERIHFENLEAYGGGVTLRLETGGGTKVGIADISAENIYCENGSRAVLLGAHEAMNGLVIIDGITAKSCAWAVSMGSGIPGKSGFGDGTTLKNIHAVFGTNAAISTKGLAGYPKEYLKDLRIDENDRKQKRVRGPSAGVVHDGTQGNWKVIVENVTEEGFEYNRGITKGNNETRVNFREVLKGLPILEVLEEKKLQASKNPR